jgi:hypothetical protein
MLFPKFKRSKYFRTIKASLRTCTYMFAISAFSSQSPRPIELEQNVDVVSYTPCPIRLAEAEEENSETRDSNSSTRFVQKV